MKISPKKYAVALYQLVEAVKPSAHSAVIKDFVALLARRNQLSLVPRIIEAFNDYWLEQTDSVKVAITTARPLTSADHKHLIGLLNKQLGKTASVQVAVEPKLIGGIKIKVGDLIIDGSIQSQLANLKNSLRMS